MDENKTDTIDMDEIERDFADQVMEENRELLEQLTDRAGTYALESRSDKLYLLVKAVNLILQMVQARMKQSLGIDPAKVN